MQGVCLLSRVALRNYKSIAVCDLKLEPFSILVGPNGSGKSNFLDALRFVSEALRYTLDHALRDRGGINEVRRRSSGHPTHFAIRLDFHLPDDRRGHYAFSIGAKRDAYIVQKEECVVIHPDPECEPHAFYSIEDGQLTKASLSFSPGPAYPLPPVSQDRLYLVNMSGFDVFRPVYDALSSMGFYNLNPERIRELQAPDPGKLLNRDGSNLASVLAHLKPDIKQRIEEYLAKIVPGVTGVESRSVGPKETLEFRQDVKGARHPWRFLASNMSDGTLRALGVLVALFQAPANGNRQYRLTGIEEPEIALHPAASGILTDSLQDASTQSQVLVTSHSPDLLDDSTISDTSIIAVVSEYGDTKLGHLDPAGRSALRDHMYTAGELLRMDQLRPDPAETDIPSNQLGLFGLEA